MQRLDVYLTGFGLSRSYAAKLVAAGRVRVNGAVCLKSSESIGDNDSVEFDDFEPEPSKLAAEDIPLNIIYEDQYLMVVDKPQGMVVHESKGHSSGTLVNALLGLMKSRAEAGDKSALSTIGGEIRPGIVHRLDKDTSGLLIIAKNDDAHAAISKQMERHEVKRAYIALVHGIMDEPTTVNARIGRNPKNRLQMAVFPFGSRGRIAITHFKPIKCYRKYSLVEANLETGRTHQIRVHLAHINHPVVADPVYGRKSDAPKFGEKQLLHSYKISFVHPVTGALLELESELPDYFKKAIELAETL